MAMIHNILFLNGGRRCELLQAFRLSLQARGGGKIVVSDIVPHAPSLYFADQTALLPRTKDPNFLAAFIQLCQKEDIHLVIPTIDPDLLLLDRYRNEIEQRLPQTRLVLPPSSVVQIAANKNLTYQFFCDCGIPVAKRVDIKNEEIHFPIFVKPVGGSASEGICKIENRNQLELWLQQHNPDDFVIEEYIPGEEYTVDVLSDLNGLAVAAVVRQRLRVRGGEVTHAKIQQMPELEDLAMKIANLLHSTGPITIQFRSPDPKIYYPIEINARMGGGLPLTIAAGIDWPGMILDLYSGKTINLPPPPQPKEMNRFDQSVFFPFHRKTPLLYFPHRSAVPIRMLLLDLDDTLYPEIDYVFSGYQAVGQLVAQKYGRSIEPILRELFITRGVRHNLFALALQECGLPYEESLIHELLDAYRYASSPLKLYSDFSILRKFAATYQLSMVILTDGIPSVQYHKVHRLGIAEYFQLILCSDQLGGPQYRKPSPIPYQHILDRLNLSPHQVLAIGDNPTKDFITARALGMYTLRIRRPDGLYHRLNYTSQDHLPHGEISGFHELYELTAELGLK